MINILVSTSKVFLRELFFVNKLYEGKLGSINFEKLFRDPRVLSKWSNFISNCRHQKNVLQRMFSKISVDLEISIFHGNKT